MSEKVIYEKPSSIKVARNAKGQHSFEVKTYYNEEIRFGVDVVDESKTILEKLLKEFPND